MAKSHRLVHPSRAYLPAYVGPPKEAAAGTQPNWPNFHGLAVIVGISKDGFTNVWTKANAPGPMFKNAEDLLIDVDRVNAFDNALFGTRGGHTDVIVYDLGGQTDGTGGADHWACDFATGGAIEVCASYGRSMRCSALYEAERSECQMNGRLCGLGSTGEALSRWCAMLVSDKALWDFASAPHWVAHGMVNYVTTLVGTDSQYDPIGCGMAFLSWMIATAPSKPKQADVAQAMVSLGDACQLREVGAKFGLPAHPFKEFKAAVKALGPITTDDPFGAAANAIFY